MVSAAGTATWVFWDEPDAVSVLIRRVSFATGIRGVGSPCIVSGAGSVDSARGDSADRCILPDMPPRLQSGFILCLLLLAGAVPACAPPIPSGGFEAADPASRIYAAVRVASDYDRTGVEPDHGTLQQLIEMLLSADPAERLVAGDTLKLVTGVDLGYEPSAPLVERVVQVQRWKTWLDQKSSDRSSGDDG